MLVAPCCVDRRQTSLEGVFPSRAALGARAARQEARKNEQLNRSATGCLFALRALRKVRRACAWFMSLVAAESILWGVLGNPSRTISAKPDGVEGLYRNF
jgi:hypothetical protein